MPEKYDAFLLVSFGGPEGPDEVMPFLRNVVRGRNIPDERLQNVAEHYYHFGGVSPINGQNRKLINALSDDFKQQGLDLPIYWGNRNWHPLLADTFREMKEAGVQKVIAFVTSAFSCYSGCRQYRENVMQAQQEAGAEQLHVDKLRVFYNHPGFVGPMAERIHDALRRLSAPSPDKTRVIFTAHSIPLAMAEGSLYEKQLNESCRLVAEQVGWSNWTLCYQSRSGPPSQPWLEPDVCDYLEQQYGAGNFEQVVIAPIGFISDHMEVLFDLDTEARELCKKLGLPMERAATAGTHPDFVQMIRELVEERMSDRPKRALGDMGPSHDVCPADCCPSGRPGPRPAAAAEQP